MNIFQVLSQGKSRLHEPSMSAMLGYLLDSNKDHGLGDIVIRKLLESIDNQRFKDVLDFDFIDSQVSLEEPYQPLTKRCDIDIQIIILNNKKEEVYRIIIENKIKVGAANPKQLNNYYKAVTQEEPNIDNISFVFLTPNINNLQLTNEYENLVLKNNNHSKYWIKWTTEDNCVANIIKDILKLELEGEINPINEYMRHTLKAFIRHCLITTEPSLQRVMRSGEDLGEIIDETIIELNDVQYRVIRRDSSQIQVYNYETGDKEIAKHIISEFIKANNINIELVGNTRTIGKKFFDWCRKNKSEEV
jgi:hypothetical protein